MAAFQQWDYKENGPERWAQLDPAWAIAACGLEQSPMDLKQPAKSGAAADMPEEDDAAVDHRCGSLNVQANPVSVTLENNGATVLASCVEGTGGSVIEANGRRYQLLQFHFHSPAEHTVDGHGFALELHLVHQALPGQGPGPDLAVLGVLYRVGDTACPFLAQTFDNIPADKSTKVQLAAPITFDALELGNSPALSYPGSLTTPPCSEGVAWFVVEGVRTLSQPQLEAFVAAVPVPNARPTQPAHGRVAERVVVCCHAPPPPSPPPSPPLQAADAHKAL